MTIARAKAPKQVGRYQLVHELAPSYLGPLWAARIDGGDTLALLRLVSLVRLEADTRVRLLEAAWQAMEVRDDRVAPVTDVVASDGELSVVCEYAEGIALRAALSLASVKRKPMPVAVALRFIVDLTDGALALHRAMAELGDEAVPLFGGLSVDSVLIGVDGRASVLDASIASAASSVESLGGSPERVAYAAPEQVGGTGAIDARTDVFSLGILAWEMLSNRRLFVGSDRAVAQKVLAAKIPKLEDASRKGNLEVPKALNATVLRALSLDPAARFESMEAFRAALDATGVAPAAPEEAATYVAMIAEGSLSRTRDALSPPSNKPRTSVAAPPRARVDAAPTLHPGAEPRPSLPTTRADTDANAKPPRIARPATFRPGADPKPLARPGVEPRAVARPSLEPRAVTRPSLEPRAVARPSLDPMPAARPSVEPKAVTTSERVSIGPKADTGWRALEAPPSSVRSVPPANVRPRQITMIGLPPPAGLRPEATPPAAPAAVTAPATATAPAAATASAPVSEAPPSDDGSDEPTQQYSREHLRQLTDFRNNSPSTRPPEPASRPVQPPPESVEPPTRTMSPPTRAPDQTPFGPPVTLETPLAPQAVAPAQKPSRASEVPLPRLVSLAPTPRPLSELHTERPPPPEPEPTPPTPHMAPSAEDIARNAEVARAFDHATSSPLAGKFAARGDRVEATLPPADADVAPVRVAPAPPPARMNRPPTNPVVSPFGATQTAPFGAPPSPLVTPSAAPQSPPVPSLSPARGGEQPVFSRPPAAASASYFPSQVAPPIIHDPRANRAPATASRGVPQFTRGVLLGVLVSLGLVVTSAAIALFFMNRHEEKSDARAASGREHGKPRADSLAPHRANAAPAASAATDDGAETTADDEATDDSPSSSTTSHASTPQRAVNRAPRSTHPSHTTKKAAKKHGHFVPDDI
ncbi:MAG TPA: protein kinase [Polyangiaceae bacterium]|jgi:serine/threonine-protein kinase|nr:protein kinase [Polyangiaceae bacterium]